MALRATVGLGGPILRIGETGFQPATARPSSVRVGVRWSGRESAEQDQYENGRLKRIEIFSAAAVGSAVCDQQRHI